MAIEEYAPLHTFTYNVDTIVDPLVPFSTSQFNDGLEPVLKSLHYQVEERSERFTLYASDETSDRYLLVLPLDRYQFIFYIKDDASLLAWKKRYTSYSPSMLLKAFLPPPYTPPVTFAIPTNKAALSSRRNMGYH